MFFFIPKREVYHSIIQDYKLLLTRLNNPHVIKLPMTAGISYLLPQQCYVK